MSTLENLPTVTKLNGLPNTNLKGQIANDKTGQYDEITLIKDGNEYILFSKKDKDSMVEINPNQESAILTIIYAAFSGKGVEPDGAMVWCANNEEVLTENLGHLSIRIEPQKNNGISCYEGNLGLLISSASARGKFILESLTKHTVKQGKVKVNTNTKEEKKYITL